jgi:hypothetical protein
MVNSLCCSIGYTFTECYIPATFEVSIAIHLAQTVYDVIWILAEARGVWGQYFSKFDAVGTIATYFDRWAVQTSSKYYEVILQGRHGGLSDHQIKDGIAQRWNQSGAEASAAGTRSWNE